MTETTGYTITEMLSAFGVSLPTRVNLDDTLSKLTNSPARNTFALVAGSAAAFYAAEKGHNPNVRDVYDALVYTSTCLSVGYGTIFPVTPAGKLIGMFLMTVGPALATRVLDGRKMSDNDVQMKILSTLNQMLAELRTVQKEPRTK